MLYLHESFESMEELVMIFEFLSGLDIFERINTSAFELNEREIVSYVRQVSQLMSSYSHNIGHFDIRQTTSSTNRRSSTIKIIEFGPSPSAEARGQL